MKKVLTVLLLAVSMKAAAQRGYWQQRVSYNIDVALDVNTNKLSGTEKIDYWNNSYDTLNKVFFHLFWNAFQPNSSMDVRSRELGKRALRTDRNGNDIHDWDSRVRDRIQKLDSSEVGYNRVQYVRVNGKPQQLKLHETILEVILDKPLAPCSKMTFELGFDAQVPVMIRRAGRNNTEGVKFSMAQWYPKLAEYDENGWNANPYIAREFHGVWGDFKVNITIDKNYTVAATGVLQNAWDIGHGYTPGAHKPPRPAGNTHTWKFEGKNIHDFAWSADDAYNHISLQIPNGPMLHAFYKIKDAAADSAWANVLWAAEKILPYIEKRFGKYPWPQYSFIQAGDGGMEYAMCTFMKGPGIGLAVHEWMHSWYQQLLATNESLYAWMDEGFTSFAENEVMHYYNTTWAHQSPYIGQQERNRLAKINAETNSQFPIVQADNYLGYFSVARSPYEEPMTTHADHFASNYGYSASTYSKGAVFVAQLGYIVSDSVRDRILLDYYHQWKFKHPTPNDFIRVAEKTSGIMLHWYKEYWVNTIRTIDYGVGNINDRNGKAMITLRRMGGTPMPIDLQVTYRDGTSELYYIPLNIMYGTKPAENKTPRFIQQPWNWTDMDYEVIIRRGVGEIKEINIDPSHRMADINRGNNRLVIPD